MLAVKVLTALFSLTAVCVAAPATDGRPSMVVHEKRDGSPYHWQKQSRAYGEEILPVRIGLRQQNLDNAEQYLLDVSDPSSANFGPYYFHQRHCVII